MYGRKEVSSMLKQYFSSKIGVTRAVKTRRNGNK